MRIPERDVTYIVLSACLLTLIQRQPMNLNLTSQVRRIYTLKPITCLTVVGLPMFILFCVLCMVSLNFYLLVFHSVYTLYVFLVWFQCFNVL